jgi:hypothetical protein
MKEWGTSREYVRELIRPDKEHRLGNLEQDLIGWHWQPTEKWGFARKILSLSDEFLVASDLRYVARLLLQSNSKIDCCYGNGIALQVSAFNPI